MRPASRAGPGGSVLYGLLRRYRTGALGRPIALAALGGVLGAALVSVVNTDMALALEGSLLAAAGFAAALGLMLWCNRTSSARAIGLFEDVQRGLREELAEGLARAPLRAVEQRRDAHGRLFGDLVYLTMAVTPQVSLIQHGAVIASVTVILALLSLEALAIWLLTVGLIAGRLLPRIRALRATRRALSTSGQALHGALEELLAGFKQLKLDPVAGGAMAAEVKRLDREITAGRIRAEAYKDASMSSANLLFYGVGLGLPLFASPSTLGLGPDLTYQVVILLSLTLGSLYGLLQAVPALGQAETTARVVVDALDELATTPAEAPGEPGGRVERIEWRRLRFAYGGDQGFAVGPVSLDLEPGRLVMVTGRNGAGKTTLMKMLCGLYPTTGRIVWDGRTVTGPRWSTYRGLFTVVVSGQHLFDRLYGIDVPRERVDRLLVRLGIGDVVGYDGTTFGDLSLSSGQRMRLALAVALLEDRPVCIFDEWTANQDPEATRFYHDTLLPELLAAGRAVIAVSHDDRYFDRADQILELGDGRLRIDPGGQAPPG